MRRPTRTRRSAPSASAWIRAKRFCIATKAPSPAQFDSSREQLEAGTALAGAGTDLLLFYDHNDRFIGHTEGNRVAALCPGARLVKTRA